MNEAANDCSSLGGRLYQPRSSEAMKYFLNTEIGHWILGLFWYAFDKGHIAIGLEYRAASGFNTNRSSLYYR